jgi:arylsulfatase A-like enzyme
MPRYEPKKPNIVFILADQWRGDCLSVTGHPVVETPHLDMMARQGAVFTRAYAACPSCIAARACLMTGQSPSTVGRLGYQDWVPWRYETTLPGELAKAGYQCHLVGKSHFYPQRIHMGFHSIESYECLQNLDGDYVNDYFAWLSLQPGGPWEETQSGLDSNSWVARPSPLPEHLHVNSWTVTRSIDFLQRRDPTRPFFLNVSFHRPHPPLDPPPEYFHMYDAKDLPPLPMGDWASENDHPVDGVSASFGRLPRAEADRQRRAYYGQVTHIDSQIGRLLLYLQRTGLIANTIFVFTSDHGELLGDHGCFRKILSLEGSAKIPLILAAPPRLRPQKGLASDLPVTHMDLMPTLLELAGAPVPATVEGASLLPILEGRQAADSWRDCVHGEHARRGAPHGGVQYLVGRREKYTWFTRDGLELLFDLVDDPNEIVNLAARPEAAQRLAYRRRRLAEELGKRPQDGLSDGANLIPGRDLPATRAELLTPYHDNEGRPRPGVEVSQFAESGGPFLRPPFWPRKS